MGWAKGLILLLLAIGSGVLYRCGGSGNYPRQLRLFGVPTLATIALIMFGGLHFWWVYLICFGLLYAAILTYWDFLFGYDCFWFSGLVVGFSFLPLQLVYGKYIGFVIRMAIISGVWQALNKLLPQKVFCWTRDIVEEFGRGFITIITLPLIYL